MSEEAQQRNSEGESTLYAGNYELEECKFKEAIALEDSTINVRLHKGITLEGQRKLDDALREYDKVLELFPDCGSAWTRKANVLNDRKLFEEAAMCADNALRLNSKDSEAWDQKGHALEMQHKIDEAMVCYDEMIRLSPAEGWIRKGNLLASEYFDFENAIICFDKGLVEDEENGLTWNGKGSAYYLLGLFEEAIKCYDISLKDIPYNPDLWLNKGLCIHFKTNL